MATVLTFPRAVAAPPPARPQLTYGMFDILRRLGAERRSQAWQLDYVRALIAREAFPEPLPHPLGQRWLRGADGVTPRARWQRAAVDAWFEGLLPPPAREAAAVARADADALDANAAALGAEAAIGTAALGALA